MTFKASEFSSAKFRPRTARVAVPALAAWFDGPAEWLVRGLTAHELAAANEAAERSNTIGELIKALSGGSAQEQAEALRAALGLGSETPADIIKRIELLRRGSPDLAQVSDAHSLCVKVAERFPIEFYDLTNHILKLTGQGAEPGKPTASGATPASEAA
jgi:hypothetical protein